MPARGRRSPLSSARTDLASRLRPLQAELRARLSRPEVLAEILRGVTISLDPDRVADAVVAQAADWLPISAWVIFAADEVGDVRTMGARGLTPAIETAGPLVGQWVMRTGDLCASMNLAEDRRFPGAPAAAALAFPLKARTRTIGALVGLDRTPSSREPKLAPRTLSALQIALEAGSIALDTALHVQRAEALSVTDDLTQLYNSRYLSQVLRRETKRASRNGRPLSLLFIDLDGFKTVNDSHGHLFGSRALVEAAAVIKASARETDVVARFGGDEFSLVLPDTGSDGALAVGERIRERIAEHEFLHAEGFDMKLTVSVGVATLPDVAMTAESLIQAADQAMYYVKDRGKNGIHVAGTLKV